MSQRLPSTFLEFSKGFKNEFLSASKGIVEDVAMKFMMASDLKLQELAEKHPKTASCIRPRYAGFEMNIKFMNPYAKVGIAIPLLGVACFNPFPGDFSAGIILISSSIPQIKADIKALKGRFNGQHRKAHFVKVREIAMMLGDRSDPNKHLVLDAAPLTNAHP